METEWLREKWKEVCFHLSKDIKQDIREDFFEQKVLTVLEKLGWHQYKGEIKKKPPIQVGRQTYIEPDLVLYGFDKRPEIVIEVKRPILDLSDKQIVQQLTSYMRQLKADFGFIIGNEIHIYYDGSLNPEHYPVLLAKNQFDPESQDGIMLIEILSRKSFLEKKFDAYLHQCIDRHQEGKKLKDLMNLLVSNKTKGKIVEFLKREFSDYGTEIVTEALQKIEVNVCPVDIPAPIQAEIENKGRAKRGKGQAATPGQGTKGQFMLNLLTQAGPQGLTWQAIRAALIDKYGQASQKRRSLYMSLDGVQWHKTVGAKGVVTYHLGAKEKEHGWVGITQGKSQVKPHFGHKAEEVTAAIEEYQSKKDDIFRDFIADHCLVAWGASATSKELYQAYKNWVEAAGETPLSKRTFGMSLGKLGFIKFKGSAGKRYWRGVSLKKSD